MTETEQYEEALLKLWRFLKPQNVLEETFTMEIMTATWRLRSCGLLEAALATRELIPEDLAKEQKSIDHARAQAHNILRRSTAELRKLQTESAIRAELAERGFDIDDFPGLTDSRQLLSTIKAWDKHRAAEAKRQPAKEDANDNVMAMMAQADQALGMKTPFGSSFCNPAQSAPSREARNGARPPEGARR